MVLPDRHSMPSVINYFHCPIPFKIPKVQKSLPWRIPLARIAELGHLTSLSALATTATRSCLPHIRNLRVAGLLAHVSPFHPSPLSQNSRQPHQYPPSVLRHSDRIRQCMRREPVGSHGSQRETRRERRRTDKHRRWLRGQPRQLFMHGVPLKLGLFDY